MRTTRKLRQTAVAAAVLVAASCDAQTVLRLAADRGVHLTPDQAEAVAVHHTAHPEAIPVTLSAAVRPGGTVVELIREVFAEDPDRAVRIARCESSLNPRAKNPTSSAAGLMQLTKVHAARAARLGYTWQQVSTDALANLVVAHDLWSEQGWRPWECR